MKRLIRAFSTALVIFFYITESYSLECYSCATLTNSSNNCEMIDSHTDNETCAENVTHCVSILSFDTITRKCATNNTICDQQTEGTQCLECTSDLCNNHTFSLNGTNATIPTTTVPVNNTNSTIYNMTTISPIHNTTNTTIPKNNTIYTKGSAAGLQSQILPLIICIMSIMLNADKLFAD
ncbi:uncharacterized protein LOC130453263 [Diorhabda sublineata]|uniref:uncharacterized protein LOC130453263 n=1 Tax=Diorhabda sublineata TaxID=1163346 RepID=UPI0024E13C41|nr:uncharacterized protein LOC130453263 [Diorhabda sublineata]